jgi:hypothetical protein
MEADAEAVTAVERRWRVLAAQVVDQTRAAISVQPPRPKTNAIIGWLFGITLALVGLAFLPELSNPMRQALLVLGLALACVLPVLAARERGIDVFEIGIAVALVYFALFPVRALVVLLGLDFATNARVAEAPTHDTTNALAVATVGLLAGGLAYTWSRPAQLGRRVRVPLVKESERPRFFPALLVFACGLSAEAVLLHAQQHPGQTGLEGRSASVVSAGTILLVIGLCLLTRRAALEGTRTNIAVVIVAVALASFVGVVGQYKEAVLLALLAPTIMVHYSRPKGLPVRWIAIVVAMALFLVFPLVNVSRLTSDRLGTHDPLKVAGALPHQLYCCYWVIGGPRPHRLLSLPTQPLLVVTHRLYGFDSLVLAVRYTPHPVPFQHEQTLTALGSGLVPRAIWPEKPTVGMGYWFALNYWGTPPGVVIVPQSTTHLGELYIDYGATAVVLGLALLGLLYRFGYTALSPRTSGTGALAYTVVFLTVIVIDRDIQLVYVTLAQRVVVTALVLLVFGLVFGRLRQA